MLIQEIKQLILDKELASLEIADADSTELTGYFLSATDELIVMQLIGNNGTSDGFTLFEPEFVSEVYWGNHEHQCIQTLAKQKSQITPVLFKSTHFKDAIIELSNRYHSIGLHFLDDSESFEACRVTGHDDEWLKLLCSGTLKTFSPLTKLTRLDNICRVEFGSDYLTDLARLHDGAGQRVS